jgi:hypothetical protein
MANETKELQKLARAAIRAKLAYWDANRALEMATCKRGQDEWSDRINDSVEEAIEDACAACTTARDINREMIADVLGATKGN